MIIVPFHSIIYAAETASLTNLTVSQRHLSPSITRYCPPF